MKILLFVEDGFISEGIQSLISKEKNCTFQIGESELESLDLVNALGFNLVVMNSKDPLSTNFALIREIKDSNKNLPILMLIDQFSKQDIEYCMLFGVNGFLHSNDYIDIVKAVDISASGKLYLSQKIMEVLEKNTEESDPRNYQVKNIFNLTERELQVAEYIISGFTSRNIADSLFISVRTVDTHRRNIIKKMKVKNSVEMTRKLKDYDLIRD